jgi:acetyl esterase/lipase
LPNPPRAGTFASDKVEWKAHRMVARTLARTGMAALLAIASPALAQHREAHPPSWQPSPGHIQEPIWPGAVPDPLPDAKPETLGPPPGREWWPRVNDVSTPTMTVYAPKGRKPGAAMLVLPGGGYQFLAMDLEGTEICDWLVARGITCVLLKYRVPYSGPSWREDKRFYPKVPTALQDAQRALGLIRQRAARYHLDPHKIGVIGFSAGGHMAAGLSTRFARRAYPPVDSADSVSCRPDFAIIAYPGHLWAHEDEDAASRDASDLKLRPDIRVTAETPPTFLIHVEDDAVDSVQQSLTYFVALKEAGVPAELHVYAKGGHAFGVRPTKAPIGGWTVLAERWLRTIGVLRP